MDGCMDIHIIGKGEANTTVVLQKHILIP